MAWKFSDGGGENNAAIKGLSQIGGASTGGSVGIYSSSTTQHHPLGYKVEFDDGRLFRYAHFVSAVPVGKLAALDASVAIQTSFDSAFVDSAGTGSDYAVGAKTVYVKSSDITSDDAADVFADGYLHITDDTGEGYTYRIKSNDAGAAETANVMRIDLYDGLNAAIVSEGSCSITGNRYRNLAVYNAATDDMVSGNSVATQAAGDYGFVQTRGVSTILADESAGTIAAGTIAQASDAVDGAAQPFGGGATNSEDDHSYSTEPIIGTFLTAAVTAEYVAIDLNIE
tara:strand:- start:120 stop:971 length:852 start_codon:yes stop_codon:yes gene_type:complete